jgi:hypothetical protein
MDADLSAGSVACDPAILRLRRALDSEAAAALKTGERSPHHLVDAIFRSLPSDIVHPVLLPADGTDAQGLAVRFRADFDRYVAFAAEYWFRVIHDGIMASGVELHHQGQMINLRDARANGDLDDFVLQEEARGIGPIDRAEFGGAVAKLIKERRSEGRTSRSAFGGNSSGKRTRRGSGPDASS